MSLIAPGAADAMLDRYHVQEATLPLLMDGKPIE